VRRFTDLVQPPYLNVCATLVLLYWIYDRASGLQRDSFLDIQQHPTLKRSILTTIPTGRHNHHLLPRPQLAPLQDPATTRDIRNHRRHHPRPIRHGPHSRLSNLHLPNRVHDQLEPSRQSRSDLVPLHHRIGSRSAVFAQQLAACAQCGFGEYGGAVWTGLCDCGGVVQ